MSRVLPFWTSHAPHNHPAASSRQHTAPRAHVGGTVMGDFYKDSSGGLWKYEYKSSGALYGQTRGITNQYDELETSWYDQSLFDSKPDALNTDMDAKAANWTALNEAGSVSIDPITKLPKTKTTADGGGGGGGISGKIKPPVLSKEIGAAMTPAKQPVWRALAVLLPPAFGYILFGGVGGAVGLGIGGAAYLYSK